MYALTFANSRERLEAGQAWWQSHKNKDQKPKDMIVADMIRSPRIYEEEEEEEGDGEPISKRIQANLSQSNPTQDYSEEAFDAFRRSMESGFPEYVEQEIEGETPAERRSRHFRESWRLLTQDEPYQDSLDSLRLSANSDILGTEDEQDYIVAAIEKLLRIPITPTSSIFKGPDGKPLGIEVAINAYQRGEYSTGDLHKHLLPRRLSTINKPSLRQQDNMDKLDKVPEEEGPVQTEQPNQSSETSSQYEDENEASEHSELKGSYTLLTSKTGPSSEILEVLDAYTALGGRVESLSPSIYDASRQAIIPESSLAKPLPPLPQSESPAYKPPLHDPTPAPSRRPHLPPSSINSTSNSKPARTLPCRSSSLMRPIPPGTNPYLQNPTHRPTASESHIHPAFRSPTPNTLHFPFHPSTPYRPIGAAKTHTPNTSTSSNAPLSPSLPHPRPPSTYLHSTPPSSPTDPTTSTLSSPPTSPSSSSPYPLATKGASTPNLLTTLLTPKHLYPAPPPLLQPPTTRKQPRQQQQQQQPTATQSTPMLSSTLPASSSSLIQQANMGNLRKIRQLLGSEEDLGSAGGGIGGSVEEEEEGMEREVGMGGGFDGSVVGRGWGYRIRKAGLERKKSLRRFFG